MKKTISIIAVLFIQHLMTGCSIDDLAVCCCHLGTYKEKMSPKQCKNEGGFCQHGACGEVSSMFNDEDFGDFPDVKYVSIGLSNHSNYDEINKMRVVQTKSCMSQCNDGDETCLEIATSSHSPINNDSLEFISKQVSDDNDRVIKKNDIMMKFQQEKDLCNRSDIFVKGGKATNSGKACSLTFKASEQLIAKLYMPEELILNINPLDKTLQFGGVKPAITFDKQSFSDDFGGDVSKVIKTSQGGLIIEVGNPNYGLACYSIRDTHDKSSI